LKLLSSPYAKKERKGVSKRTHRLVVMAPEHQESEYSSSGSSDENIHGGHGRGGKTDHYGYGSDSDGGFQDGYNATQRSGSQLMRGRKKSRRELFQDGIEMLEGTETNRTLAIMSFSLACICTVFGICSPLEHIQGSYRSFSFLASLFLVNQAFFVVKILRDGEVTSMKDARGRIPPEYHFLQGAISDAQGHSAIAPHRVICFWSFFFALAATGYGIYAMDAQRYTQLFIGLSTLYMMSASLNLAMTTRDRFEAVVWEAESQGRHIESKKVELATRNITQALAYHQGLFIVTFLFIFFAAIGIMVFAIIDFGLKEKGIGLLSSAVVFSIGSSWNLSRALNSRHRSVDISVFILFIVAIGLTATGLILVKLHIMQRIVLGLGVVIILDATYNFSKAIFRGTKVRRLEKLIKYRFQMDYEVPGKAHAGHAGANTGMRAGHQAGAGKGLKASAPSKSVSARTASTFQPQHHQWE